MIKTLLVIGLEIYKKAKGYPKLMDEKIMINK